MARTASIEFHFQTDILEIPSSRISKWIKEVILRHGAKCGNVSIVFCDDEYLLKLNREFLNHDYYTDIISFPLSTTCVEGELYISLDRVKDNANALGSDFEMELLRVIIHGILHLIGFKDVTAKQKAEMRTKEEEALTHYKKEFLKDVSYYDLVYDVVRCIPKGKVCTYGAISDFLALGSARMVGWALNQLKGNSSDVPAHRVVNVKGELSGRLMFGEAGERMGRLLREEGINVIDHKVKPMEDYIWYPSSMSIDPE